MSTAIKHHGLLSEPGLLKAEPRPQALQVESDPTGPPVYRATATEMWWDSKHKWVELAAVVWHKLGEVKKVPLGPGSSLSSGSGKCRPWHSHPWSRP